eukprot:jgi/Bigna1/86456/estExt_fgenesh1_pg.C_100288
MEKAREGGRASKPSSAKRRPKQTKLSEELFTPPPALIRTPPLLTTQAKQMIVELQEDGKDKKGNRGYNVIGCIGKGKFSVVYKAEQNQKLFAMKKVQIFEMMSIRAREKCLKEIRLIQSMSHPNIVKYIDSYILDNELIIILEWAEGGDLKNLIRRVRKAEKVFSERQIWNYAAQLAAGLQHMHEKRVMHRDLKPANIMLTRDNRINIGDLGLSRYFTSQTLEAFSKVGTPLYMSPEVLQGDGYGFSADVWSLGCILYELCMLKSPFKPEKGVNLYELFRKIKSGVYQKIPEGGRYSNNLRHMIHSLMLLAPEKRLKVDEILKIALRNLEIATNLKREREIQQRRQRQQQQQQQPPSITNADNGGKPVKQPSSSSSSSSPSESSAQRPPTKTSTTTRPPLLDTNDVPTTGARSQRENIEKRTAIVNNKPGGGGHGPTASKTMEKHLQHDDNSHPPSRLNGDVKSTGKVDGGGNDGVSTRVNSNNGSTATISPTERGENIMGMGNEQHSSHTTTTTTTTTTTSMEPPPSRAINALSRKRESSRSAGLFRKESSKQIASSQRTRSMTPDHVTRQRNMEIINAANKQTDSISLMESIIDKLKMMDYETNFCRECLERPVRLPLIVFQSNSPPPFSSSKTGFCPLDRTFFAIKAVGAGHGQRSLNSGLYKFGYLHALVLWLSWEAERGRGRMVEGDIWEGRGAGAGVEDDFAQVWQAANARMEDPGTMIENIRSSFIAVGMRMDTTSTSFRLGFGAEVCQALIKLVDNVSRRRRRRHRGREGGIRAGAAHYEVSAKYPTAAAVEEIDGDDAAAIPIWIHRVEALRRRSSIMSEVLGCREKIDSMASNIQSSLERISKFESLLGGMGTIDSLKSVRSNNEELISRYDTSQESMEKLTCSLQDLEKKIEETSGKLEVENARLHDTSKLELCRKALKTVRKEIADMEVRINILKNQLLSYWSQDTAVPGSRTTRN